MPNNFEFKIMEMHRLKDNQRIRAFVDVLVNEAILIKGLRVIQGKKNLFVSMPGEKGKNERWYREL